MKSLLLILFSVLLFSQCLYAQALSPEQKKYIAKNFISLKVDEDYQNGKWKPVLKAVKDKRLVFLGEFNHGSREVFTTRNELIKILHKKLGFDLILFESGLGGLEVINLRMDQMSSKELISGFFGPWRTEAFEDLMTYIKNNDLQISGFDVQRTSHLFTSYLSEKEKAAIHFRETEQQFNALKSKLSNFRTDYEEVNKPSIQLIAAYEKLLDQIDNQDGFSKRALSNRIRYLRYMLDFTKTKDWNKRWEERDLAMANNIKWILSKFPADQKAIIIAHNFHVSKYNEKENVMGEFLKEEFEKEMYVIGTFAGAGTFLNNPGKIERLSPPSEKELDIKHIIEADQAKMSFFNIPKDLPQKAIWLQAPITANDTFIDLFRGNQLIISKCFDGILLFDNVTAARKSH